MIGLQLLLAAALASAQSEEAPPGKAEATQFGLPSAPRAPYRMDSRIRPFLSRYRRCIDDHVAARGGRQASTAAVGALYDAAVPACAEVRARQYAAAERALSNGERMADRTTARQIVDDGFRVADRTRNLYGDAVRRELAVDAAAPDPMRGIDVPYQAIPAYSAYAQCIGGHLSADRRLDSADPGEVRRANLDAIAACRDTRAQQLALALRLQTDNRMYGSAENARAAVRRAFDRFDTDYQIEPAQPPAATSRTPHAED